jgi:AsmA family protein
MRIKRIAAIGAALAAAAAVAIYATLSSLEFEELRGIAETQVRQATGRDLKIAGAIDLQISLNPAISLEDVSFANASWGSRPAMATVKRLELEVALLPLLLGDVRIRRLVLVEPDILLETDSEGRGNWLFGDKPSEGEAGEGSSGDLPSFAEIAVRDARAVFRDGKTGRTVRLHLSGLQASAASRASPLEIAITGAANDTAFKVEGTLGSPDTFAADGAFPLKLAGEIAGVRLEVEGQIEAPLTRQVLDLSVSVKGANLADVSDLVNAPLPEMGPFSVSAQVRREGGEIAMTGLAVNVGGSDLAGNLRVSLAGARPSVNGKLTAGTIDLADFLPPDDGVEVSSEYVFLETPLPVEALAAVDGDISLSAGVLRARGGLELTDVDVRAALKGGLLAIEPLSAKLSGGTVSGMLRLDGRQTPPNFALRLDAGDVDYGQLLADMNIAEGIAGSLGATVDVRGAGASPRAIATSLNGRVEVIGGEGRIDSKLLGAADTGVLDMFSRWGDAEKDLQLNCAVVRLPVQEGVAASEAILLDTGTVTVGGEGRMDLRDETLDFRVTPQAKQASLLSLAVPFRIAGTLRQPEIGPDPLGTAVGVAKVAGLFLNPLVAGATLLIDSQTADRNPCVAALEGGPDASVQPQGTIVDKATRGVTDTLEGVGKGVGEGLKKLFGD